MVQPPQLSIRVFLAALILMEVWMVSAFGSYMGFERNNTLIFREVTRVMIPIVGILGIFVLPPKPLIPRPPPAIIACFTFLLIWGSFMIINSTADSDLTNYIPTVYPKEERLFPSLDGSHAVSASKGYLWELFGVVIFIAMISRSTESRYWRLIVICFASCALLVALVDLGHKALGLPSVWSIPDKSDPPTFFGPFIYNANAATMMILGLPVILAMALKIQKEEGLEGKFFPLASCRRTRLCRRSCFRVKSWSHHSPRPVDSVYRLGIQNHPVNFQTASSGPQAQS